MTRYVVTNAEVAHLWANQSQESARNAHNTFHFSGNVLDAYYTRADAIAAHTNAMWQGKHVVLITDRPNGGRGFAPRYSDIAWRALDRERFHIFHVPYVLDHARNVQPLFEAYKARALSLINPRSTWHDAALLPREREIYEAAQTYREYCMAFNLPEPYPNFGYYIAKLHDEFARYYDPHAVAQRNAHAAREHARQAHQLSMLAAYGEGLLNDKDIAHIKWQTMRHVPYEIRHAVRERMLPYDMRRQAITPEQWRNGEGNAYFTSRRLDDGVMVRKHGDTLETSMGARVPWHDALRAFILAQHYRALQCQEPSNSTMRLGSYGLDRISPRGDIKAGCHLIPWAESLRLAIREAPQCVKPAFPLPAVVPLDTACGI